jgi:hypothetical protein
VRASYEYLFGLSLFSVLEVSPVIMDIQPFPESMGDEIVPLPVVGPFVHRAGLIDPMQVWRRFQCHGVDGLMGDEKLQHPRQAVWNAGVIMLPGLIISVGICGTGQFHVAIVIDVKGAQLATD